MTSWFSYCNCGPGRTFVKSVQKKIYFSTKTYVLGTQKNRLNETVHGSFDHPKHMLTLMGKKIFTIFKFTLKNFVYLNLWMTKHQFCSGSSLISFLKEQIMIKSADDKTL